MDIELFIESFLFLFPAYSAAVFPVFARKIKFLNYPVNENLFGKNKTYRGFFFGILFALITVRIQYLLYEKYFVMKALALVYYDQANYMLLGFLMGFGALFGDLVKSYFKRRLKIKEGHNWIPFDQADYAIGGIMFASVIIPFTFEQFTVLILVGGLAHFIAVYVCRKIGVRKD